MPFKPSNLVDSLTPTLMRMHSMMLRFGQIGAPFCLVEMAAVRDPVER